MNIVDIAPTFLEKLAFVVLAGGAVLGALVTVTRRSVVAGLMALMATFLAVAGLYATLSAHFLAVLQILVYAGAIMVLFVFAVMIVSRDDEHPIALRGLVVRSTGVLAVGYLFYRAAWLVVQMRSTTTLARASSFPIPDFGTAKSVGRLLFSDFLFPFEAISLLLLTAVVGGVLLARPERPIHDGGHV